MKNLTLKKKKKKKENFSIPNGRDPKVVPETPLGNFEVFPRELLHAVFVFLPGILIFLSCTLDLVKFSSDRAVNSVWNINISVSQLIAVSLMSYALSTEVQGYFLLKKHTGGFLQTAPFTFYYISSRGMRDPFYTWGQFVKTLASSSFSHMDERVKLLQYGWETLRSVRWFLADNDWIWKKWFLGSGTLLKSSTITMNCRERCVVLASFFKKVIFR